MKFLGIDSVCQLIKEGGLGTYLLYNFSSGELLGGSHLANEDNSVSLAMKPDDLILDLRKKLEYLGYGKYKITSKKNNKTNNSNATTYYFEIAPTNEAPVQQPQQPAIDIEKAIAKEIEAFKVTYLQQHQIATLQLQLEEARKAKPKDSNMEGLIEVAKMGMGMILAKTAPEVIPAVNAMLGIEPETPQKPEVRTFTRPRE